MLFYDQKRDADRAIHYLKIAVNEEKNATALFNLAYIYEEKGARQRATEYYQEVLKVDPTHYQAQVNLAILCEKEGRGLEAQNHYLVALKQNKNEAKIYHNLGIHMKRAGKLEDALAYYQNAMDLEPGNSMFLYNTGVLFNIKSDYNLAVQMLEKSIANNRENVYAYLALGDALERQKHIKKAIFVYRDLMSLGITVHGLKEKLSYLEGMHEENLKNELKESANNAAKTLKQEQDAREKRLMAEGKVKEQRDLDF